MTDRSRDAYTDLIDILQDAGYTVVDEDFSTDMYSPEFEATLVLHPPVSQNDD